MMATLAPYRDAFTWLCGWVTGNLRVEDQHRAYFSGRLTAVVLFVFVALPLACVFPALPGSVRGLAVLFLLPAIGVLYWCVARAGLHAADYRPDFRRRLAHLGVLYGVSVAGLAAV